MTENAPRAGATEADLTRPEPGVPGDNTSLVGILNSLAERGFTGQMRVTDDERIGCETCGETFSPSALRIEEWRRLEGASDPDDMLSVAAARCPSCASAATLVMGYGPNAAAGEVQVARLFAERWQSRDEGAPASEANPPPAP